MPGGIEIPEKHRHTILFAVIFVLIIAAGALSLKWVDIGGLDLGGFSPGIVERTFSANEVRTGETFVVRLGTDQPHGYVSLEEKLPPGLSIVEGSANFKKEGESYLFALSSTDAGINYIVKAERPGTYEIIGTHAYNDQTYSTGKTVVRVI